MHNHISTHISLETHKLCITSIQWEKLETEVLYMSNAQGTHWNSLSAACNHVLPSFTYKLWIYLITPPFFRCWNISEMFSVHVIKADILKVSGPFSWNTNRASFLNKSFINPFSFELLHWIEHDNICKNGLQFTHKSNLPFLMVSHLQLPTCICEHAYSMYVYVFPFAFMDFIINTAWDVLKAG